MPARRTVRLALLGAALSLVACGPEDSPEAPVRKTVLERLVEAGPMSLPRSALPPIVTHCADSDANGVPKLQEGETCTVMYTQHFVGDAAAGYQRVEDIYVHAMGETTENAELNPWDRDGAHYCRFFWDVTPEAVDDHPEADVMGLAYTLTKVEDDPDRVPCSSKMLPGQEGYEYAYPSATEGVFFFLPKEFLAYQGNEWTFKGFAGVDGFGCRELFSTGPCSDGRGVMTFYEACEADIPGTGGPGYCTPKCRLFEAGNGLPVCDEAMVHDVPENPAFVDPAFAQVHPDVFNP